MNAISISCRIPVVTTPVVFVAVRLAASYLDRGIVLTCSSKLPGKHAVCIVLKFESLSLFLLKPVTVHPLKEMRRWKSDSVHRGHWSEHAVVVLGGEVTTLQVEQCQVQSELIMI